MSESITTLEITLTRLVTENGELVSKITAPKQINIIEVLGLLEFAKAHFIHRINQT